MIDKGKFNDGFVWNPSICEWECVKSCDIGDQLDYANCKCRKRLIDKLILECEDEVLNAYPINTKDTISIADKKVTCKNNCPVYIILLTIMCLISLAIVSISTLFHWQSCV